MSANLNIPRFCTTEQLASLFGFSEHWIYKLNKRGKGPPRLTGIRPYRYDTQSFGFHEWLKQMGVSARPYTDGVDTKGNENVQP